MASTSKLCQWKRSSCTGSGAPLEKINFDRPKQTDTCPKNIDDDNRTEDNLRKNFTSKRLTHELEQKFKDLKLLVPEDRVPYSLV